MEARSMGSENHQTIEMRYTIKATTILCKWPGAMTATPCTVPSHIQLKFEVCLPRCHMHWLCWSFWSLRRRKHDT